MPSHTVCALGSVSGSPTRLHIGTRCIPAHSESGKARGPPSLFPLSLSLSFFWSLCRYPNVLFHLDRCFLTLHLFLHHLLFRRSEEREHIGCVCWEFCSSGDRQRMARSRARLRVWLWRAVTWPVAHLSTLFGLHQQAGSNRVAGRLELKLEFISQCCQGGPSIVGVFGTSHFLRATARKCLLQ